MYRERTTWLTVKGLGPILAYFLLQLSVESATPGRLISLRFLHHGIGCRKTDIVRPMKYR
jgi:hypothetical protein